MTGKLVGFGELLLRLDTQGFQRFSQAESFRARFTGGEANTCVAARRFGVESSSIVSCVPDNSIGSACVEAMQRYGLNVDWIARQGPRLGILYVENGVSVRPSQVTYDRENTSFRLMAETVFEWESIFEIGDILHVTGTAPAGGEAVERELGSAFKVAEQKSCRISFDCSYRSSLWSQKAAAAAYRRIAPAVDILFASPQDAKIFFGIDIEDSEQAIRELAQQYSISRIAYTERTIESASVNELRGVLYADGEFQRSRSYRFEVVDRIGSGDAFAGGILSGVLLGWPLDQSVEFATAAAVLKHTIPGDFCLFTADEVRSFLRDSSLRVRR